MPGCAKGEVAAGAAAAAVPLELMACVAAALGSVDVDVAVLVAAALTALVIGVLVALAVEAASFAAAPPATGDAFAGGSGCPMGVSYRMLAMKRPNMAPRPPPMTPAMTVLPTQDSIEAWI